MPRSPRWAGARSGTPRRRGGDALGEGGIGGQQRGETAHRVGRDTRRGFARELGQYGITANVILPGPIDTDWSR